MAKNQALVVGVSQYPNPKWNLPAVAGDVREIASLLGSTNGSFQDGSVSVLTDDDASSSNVLAAVENVLSNADSDDTVFLYLAGHGSADPSDNSYYFIPHDVDPYKISTTSVPLVRIRELFENCRSQKAFMWLDFCHSGGIIERAMPTTEEDNSVIERTLEVIKGKGKLIYAACAPDQKAYENQMIGHGLFTAALLDGLRGAATVHGEVTANSLFDHIDRTMGSDRQRPMQFGHMTGRLVLMHYDGAAPAPARPTSPAASATNVVNGSGRWTFLGTSFYETTSVTENTDGSITVELPTSNAEEEANIRRLRPGQFGRTDPIPFAHGNNGMLVRVSDVKSVSSGDSQSWTIALKPEDIQYGGGMMEATYQSDSGRYSPEDFARMRAGRLLLNDPPPMPDDDARINQMDRVHDAMMESYIRGSNSPVSVEHCAVRVAHDSFGDKPEFLQFARLLAIYFIRCGGVAEEVLELSLGSTNNDEVHVKFRGRRRRVASNVDPAIIEVEGVCPLST